MHPLQMLKLFARSSFPELCPIAPIQMITNVEVGNSAMNVVNQPIPTHLFAAYPPHGPHQQSKLTPYADEAH